MNNMKTTLKACPVIALATTGLCLVTQGVAKLFGIDLPDQGQIEVVRKYIGWNLTFALIVVQVVAIAPAIEELIFRLLLFKVPTKLFRSQVAATAVVSSAVFSFLHYIDYEGLFKSGKFALSGWNAAFIALFFFGMAQCWLYRKTDRIWCPMLNHALFNLTNVALLLVVPT